MGRFKRGMPWLRFDNHLPRLFLHEKHERLVRWALRSLTVGGIAASVITLPWYYSLSLATFLVCLDIFLERTLFYYTSMYVQALPDFTYDPDKWAANVFISLGEPADPASRKMVGLVFTDPDYASKFFDLLRAWNHGESDDTDRNICLSFITDEDMYYVYLYPSFDKARIRQMHREIEEKNKLRKYGKEHFGIILSMIFCRGFSARGGYALGLFADNHPEDKPFLLAPFLHVPGGEPKPLTEIEPIQMHGYKARLPGELTEDDFEYQHWNMLVQRRRLGADT